MDERPLVWLAFYWLGYFVLHSVLACLPVKRAVAARWPAAMPAYRLMFNFVAVLLVIPPLLYVIRYPGPVLWQWEGVAWWLAQGLAVAAVAGFALTLRDYDGSEFLGVRQWRSGERRIEDQERFTLSVLHRFVRHPWYSLALVLVWTRDMPAAWFVTSVAVTVYFVLGSRLEETRLEQYYGEAYRRYRQRVPGLVPLPGRWLSKDEARRLTALSVRRV